MAKIYASFDTAAHAEKAAGALLDYGVVSDDISLIRGGSEEDYNNWQSRWQGYGTEGNISGVGTTTTGTAGSLTGQSGFEGAATNEDIHLRAANKIDDTTYVNELADEDSGVREDSGYTGDDPNHLSAKTGITTTTAADSGVGAAKGAGYGLGVGIIAALAALFVPGFGMVFGAGALAMAVGGAVATTGAGAIAGAVTGYLKDQGVEESVARDYEATLTSGGALLEVNVPSGKVDETSVRDVLMKYGAANVGGYAGRSYVA
ncbi:MAG TPA: hypothetical protein VGL56_14020 [Fimbriimonadaceae bacterium]|jgi:hypothetical protein